MQLDQRETSLWRLWRPSRSRRRPDRGGPVVGRLVRGDVRVAFASERGVRHLFATTTSGPGMAAVRAVESLASAGAAIRSIAAGAAIVQQVLFVADPDLIGPCRRALLGGEAPVPQVIPQPPADGSAVAAEVWAVAPDAGPVAVEHPGPGLVRVRREGGDWLVCGPVEPAGGSPSVHDLGTAAFAAMRALLAAQGVPFERVVRTWLYLGDIVGPEGDTQRYKELNRARADVFADLPFGTDTGFPASTGIGSDGRGLVTSCLALQAGGGAVRAVALENPRQTAAFDYTERYSPQSPKFSRAMAVASGDDALIFISGTASITRSETRHVGDPAAQTRETLDNIEALISGSNLRRHGVPGLACGLADLGVARVYVKRPGDYEAIRRVCEARLGPVPVCYTIADVCRPELLVEIEGIAFARRAADD
jgi:enamine deaminase RidA (YjgF/YER057c/UK114 family)